MRVHFLLVVALSACTGELVPDQPPPPRIAADQFAGRVVDYFSGVPLEGAMVRTKGIGYELEAYGVSDAQGAFLLDSVPGGSEFRIHVELPGYTATNSTLLRNNGAQAADVFAVSTTQLQGLYQAVGQTPTLGQSTLLAELMRGEGGGREGVLSTQMGLAPIGGVGPFFYNGTLKEGLASELDDQGRAIVAYLNVAVGQYEFRAVYPQDDDGGDGGGGGGGNGNQAKVAAFTSLANEVVMVRVNDPALKP